MADEEKPPSAKKLSAEVEMAVNSAGVLERESAKLIEDVTQLNNELSAYSEEIPQGGQEDVFLQSAAIREKKSRPSKNEYIHMLSGLLEDGQIQFYHRGKNITPLRGSRNGPAPYLHPSEIGFETFIREVDLSIAANSPSPGFAITGEGIERLFSNHQNMLHTASMLTNWFGRVPVHIDYDIATFRKLEYDTSEKFPFSLFTPSIAEQAWHIKMMMLRHGKYAQKLTPDIEFHRVRYWETVRDFPIGDRKDLTELSYKARAQLQQYPGLLEGVVVSLESVSVHLPL